MFRRLFFLVFICTPALSVEIWLYEGSERIVSPSSIFELGLFKDGTGWYLGIWFKQFPGRVVWTGNRGSPLYSSTGDLQISSSGIQLFDETGYMTWQTDLTNPAAEDAPPLTASLSDTGNFIVSYKSNNNPNGIILWQSFDHPSDVLLPGMELGMEYPPRVLSSGTFRYGRGETGYQYYIWNSLTKTYRIDPIYYGRESPTISLPRATTTSYHATLQLLDTGSLFLSEWTPQDKEWKKISIAPSDSCEKYTTCGANTNTYCSMKPLKSCECFPGFRSPTASRGNCVRKSPMTCSDDNGFQPLKNMKLPETDNWTISYEGVGLEECKERCLRTCNCTAFANTDIPNGVRSCVMWTRSLEDTRRYSTNRGQNLYVKLAALDMERKRKNQNKKNLTIGLIVGVSLLLLLIAVVVTFCCWKRIKNAVFLAPGEVTSQNLPVEEEEEMTTGGWTSSFIQFDVIAQATNNFQDEIGSGGFANVYRGRLVDGRDIAVKRLYKRTAEAIQGFWNEVNLIAVLQHTNLVRLIGYFHDPETKILVYEYLPNSSLNTYIYKTTRSNVLDWNERMDIAKGIARGLLYLHQDSRIRIIHLDLKLSNILLCDQMIPKISDFGMAKRLDVEYTQAVTSAVAGTHGYMAPEYALDGVFSVKADVFSFGMLLLEMVSGINARKFNRENEDLSFLSFTWNLWLEGKVLEIVDPYFTSSSSSSSYQPEEALRCIQIALLCVQGHAEDRPPKGCLSHSWKESFSQPLDRGVFRVVFCSHVPWWFLFVETKRLGVVDLPMIV